MSSDIPRFLPVDLVDLTEPLGIFFFFFGGRDSHVVQARSSCLPSARIIGLCHHTSVLLGTCASMATQCQRPVKYENVAGISLGMKAMFLSVGPRILAGTE